MINLIGKKPLLKSMLFAAIIGAMSTSYAQSYQNFLGLNYSNPAALNTVKEFQGIIGGAKVLLNSQFTGTYANVPGSVTSRTNNFLPYGRIAFRVNPQVVAGVDITQPLFFAFSYPTPSFMDRASVNTYLRDVDISPRVSWQVNEKLALGIGLNLNYLYNATFAFRVAPRGTLSNKGDSWGYGWNIGGVYAAKLGTYLGLSYYSKIVQHIQGFSTWGALRNNNTRASVIDPATINANVVQYVTPDWIFNATVRYTFWSPVRYLNIQNSALPGASRTITIPEFNYNQFDYSLATKYDFNTKWSGLGMIEYSPTSQATAYRGLGLPIGTAWILALGGEYHIEKGLKAKFVYGHVFEHPQIHKQYSTGLATGRLNLVINSYDFSLIYDI